jgi:hypothetical protein
LNLVAIGTVTSQPNLIDSGDAVRDPNSFATITPIKQDIFP